MIRSAASPVTGTAIKEPSGVIVAVPSSEPSGGVITVCGDAVTAAAVTWNGDDVTNVELSVVNIPRVGASNAAISVGVASTDHNSLRANPSTIAWRPSGDTVNCDAGGSMSAVTVVAAPSSSTAFSPMVVAISVLVPFADAACTARPSPITETAWRAPCGSAA